MSLFFSCGPCLNYLKLDFDSRSRNSIDKKCFDTKVYFSINFHFVVLFVPEQQSHRFPFSTRNSPNNNCNSFRLISFGYSHEIHILWSPHFTSVKVTSGRCRNSTKLCCSRDCAWNSKQGEIVGSLSLGKSSKKKGEFPAQCPRSGREKSFRCSSIINK